MTIANTVEYAYASLDEAFPNVDPGIEPLGSRVLVQIRAAKKKTKGGILLTNDARETEHYNTQIARVIAIGPLAFRKRDTMEQWPEGAWVDVGDFIRCPRYGGDRWSVPVAGDDQEVVFALFDDLNLVGKVTGDPTKIKAFL